MAQTMEPVIAKIVQYKGQHPGPPMRAVHKGKGKVLGDEIIDVAANPQRDKPSGLAQNSHEQTTDRVVEAIGVASCGDAISQLHHD